MVTARGEPIAARPAGRRERLARWVRHHPGAAGLLVALAVLVAATGTGALLLYQQQLAARARQERLLRDIRESRTMATTLVIGASSRPSQAKPVDDL